MATPHINAEMGDFAEVVLMPGDPLRAQFIAENFLDNAKQVCNVRNMFGYTGSYKGKEISVMGHGMGIPSCSIYATELMKDFGVKQILRIGSCGAISDDVQLGDVVIAMGASTNSRVNRLRFDGNDFAAIADHGMLLKAYQAAEQCGVNVRVGNVFTDDLFYTPKPEFFKVMHAHGILGVEMEAAGLYGAAAEYGVKALAMCTVSDHITTGEKMTAEERVTSFNSMIDVALTSIA